MLTICVIVILPYTTFFLLKLCMAHCIRYLVSSNIKFERGLNPHLHVKNKKGLMLLRWYYLVQGHIWCGGEQLNITIVWPYLLFIELRVSFLNDIRFPWLDIFQCVPNVSNREEFGANYTLLYYTELSCSLKSPYVRKTDTLFVRIAYIWFPHPLHVLRLWLSWLKTTQEGGNTNNNNDVVKKGWTTTVETLGSRGLFRSFQDYDGTQTGTHRHMESSSSIYRIGPITHTAIVSHWYNHSYYDIALIQSLIPTALLQRYRWFI